MADAPEENREQRSAESTPAPRDIGMAGRIARSLYFLIWLFAAPFALALLSVWWIKPTGSFSKPGVIQQFVAEQQVPATILIFTLFAMLLWRFRYALPFATTMGIVGRPDIPRALRPRYDEAAHLLDEAGRTMRTNKLAIERVLKASDQEAISEAINTLTEVLEADAFDESRFVDATEQLQGMVEKHLKRWRKSELREYGESIGIAVAVALLLRFFVVEAFKIPSGSMIPTLMIGDHIFVAKYAYGPLIPRTDHRLRSRMPPDRGDVTVFKFPENKEQDFIKRVVALPGDKLEVLDGRPVLNGFLVPNCYVGKLDIKGGASGHLYLEYLDDEAYLTMHDQRRTPIHCHRDRDCGGNRQCRGGSCGLLQGPYRVAANEVWVMGDNRDNSHDSRHWRGGMGAGVPFENVKGRAMFVWWGNFDRLLVDVMGVPHLPDDVSSKLRMGLQKCMRERPPLSKTTPPRPR